MVAFYRNSKDQRKKEQYYFLFTILKIKYLAMVISFAPINIIGEMQTFPNFHSLQ